MNKKIRQIKLQPRHRSLTWGETRIVPSLMLSGLWLEQNGFKAGDMVTITVEQNQLTIKTNL